MRKFSHLAIGGESKEMLQNLDAGCWGLDEGNRRKV